MASLGGELHGLTFDVEDWHALVRRRLLGVDVEPPFPDTVRDTHRVLDLLDEADAKATFFVVGWVAEAHPGLVKEIDRRGHEIGSHSHAHRLVAEFDPAALREDVRRSRGRLQDVTGQAVRGFRAPEFSVERLDHWCFGVLAEAGLTYDSSVFPGRAARYAIADAPWRPFAIATEHGSLAEFPLATVAVGKERLPVAGGTYFRLLPATMLRWAIRRLERAGGTAVLYFHPYEFHRGLLRVRDVGWRRLLGARSARLHALHNLATPFVGQRLRSLLSAFRFAPLGVLLDREHTITRTGQAALRERG